MANKLVIDKVKKIYIVLIVLILCSCTGLRVSNNQAIITVKKEQPACDIKKVDANCKIETQVVEK